jgi:hypothetical protein
MYNILSSTCTQDGKDNQLGVQTPTTIDASSSPLNQLINITFLLVVHYFPPPKKRKKQLSNHFSHHSSQETSKTLFIISCFHVSKMTSLNFFDDVPY